MSAAAESTPAPVDLAALLDSQWVLVPTIQTMHDGSELRTWGVQANGVWIGRAPACCMDLRRGRSSPKPV